MLVLLGTPYLYGLERAVINTMDALRPEVEPHLLLAQVAKRRNLPILDEVRSRGLRYSFFSDSRDWPILGKPRSLRHLAWMLYALTKGNLDALRLQTRAEVIYLPNAFSLCYSVAACAVARFGRKQVIYAFHDVGGRPADVLKLFHLLVTDFVYGSAFVEAAVKATRPYIESRPGRTISPLVPLSHSTGEGPLESFSASRNIVFLGQVARHKGADILLDAFAVVNDAFPDTALHLFGGVQDRDFGALLKNKMQLSSLEAKVHLWGYREDAREALRHAYVYVQPSVPSLCQESFGMGVVEAMSASVPAIVFRSGALSEIVVHKHSGLVCENATANDLASALGILLQQVSLRNQYGDNARVRYERYYSAELVKRRWISLLRSR